MIRIALLFLTLTFSTGSIAGPVEAPQQDPEIIRLVSSGQIEKLSKALKKPKVQIDEKDAEGNTALFYSISSGHPKVTTMLIQNGAQVELVFGEKKESLLFECIRFGNLGAAKEILVKAPQLKSLKNKDGQTPLDFAREQKAEEFVQLLLK